jgi:hypothetical protein
MKLLPDENLPKRLEQEFPFHQVFTDSPPGYNKHLYRNEETRCNNMDNC